MNYTRQWPLRKRLAYRLSYFIGSRLLLGYINYKNRRRREVHTGQRG